MDVAAVQTPEPFRSFMEFFSGCKHFISAASPLLLSVKYGTQHHIFHVSSVYDKTMKYRKFKNFILF
jgi:hypothetical protein